MYKIKDVSYKLNSNILLPVMCQSWWCPASALFYMYVTYTAQNFTNMIRNDMLWSSQL